MNNIESLKENVVKIRAKAKLLKLDTNKEVFSYLNKYIKNGIIEYKDRDIRYIDVQKALKYPEYSCFITSMQGLFYEYKGKIDLGVFDTSNVTNMSSMFCECKIESLDLSSFNTYKVTNMSYMFCGCKAKSIDLSSFNTSNVTNMDYMFWRCKTELIDLSSFDTSNVKDRCAMLFGYKMKSQGLYILIPNFKPGYD